MWSVSWDNSTEESSLLRARDGPKARERNWAKRPVDIDGAIAVLLVLVQFRGAFSYFFSSRGRASSSSCLRIQGRKLPGAHT
jgi:hypothetical protein